MQTNKDLYIISFGTSSSYRLYVGKDTIESEIRDYLKKTFPDGGKMRFLDSAQIKRVEPRDEEKYASYPPLDATALKTLEKHLDVEQLVKRATTELNSNAPFGALNPDALK